MTTRLPIDIVVTTTPTGTICLKGADAVATDVLSNDLLAISVGILLYRITGEENVALGLGLGEEQRTISPIFPTPSTTLAAAETYLQEQRQCDTSNDAPPSSPPTAILCISKEKDTGTTSLPIPLTQEEAPLRCVVTTTTCYLEYDSTRISSAYADSLLRTWTCILRHLNTSPPPTTLVKDILYLDDIDRAIVLTHFNRPIVSDYKKQYNRKKKELPLLLHHLFQKQVSKYPKRIAVEGPRKTMSYQELDHQANLVAHYLIQRCNIQPEEKIALLFPRSVESYVALLGVLKAGAAYVPLDVSFPVERIKFTLGAANAKVLLSPASFHPACLAYTSDTEQCTAVALDSIMDVAHNPSANDKSMSKKPPTLKDTNEFGCCYIIFTSGSTGRPKGVQIHHRAAVNLVLAEAQVYTTKPDDRVLQGFSLAFDASVEEVWMAWNTGATLVVGTTDTMKAGPDLPGLLTTLNITCLSTVPTLLNTIPVNELPTVRLIIVGGEACSRELANRWSANKLFFNTYGPTEATVVATVQLCRPKLRQERVPIGVPLSNYRVYVVAPGTVQLVPPGAVGELMISGEGVSRLGYIGDPAKTNARFVPDPYVSAHPDNNVPCQMYHSGDLVRFDPRTGDLEFCGRMDQQVKIRGYRVELSEIESVIMEVGQEDIQSAVVDVRGDRLVGFVVLRVKNEDEDTTQDHAKTVRTTMGALKEKLSTLLASYMIPAVIHPVMEIPKLTSGKVVRSALVEPVAENKVEDVEDVEDAGEVVGKVEEVETVEKVEEVEVVCAVNGAAGIPAAAKGSEKQELTKEEMMVYAVFEEQLGKNIVTSVQDSFFELGGHSLLVSRAVTSLRTACPSISARDFYQSKGVIQTLALVIAEKLKQRNTVDTKKRLKEMAKLHDVRRKPRTSVQLCCADVFQTLSLWFVALFGLLHMYGVITIIVFIYSEADFVVMLTWFVGLSYGLMVYSLVLAFLCKWLLIGKYKEGVYPLWGCYHLRWWFVRQLLRASSGVMFTQTCLAPVLYRLMGAKVGTNVFLGSASYVTSEFDLIEIGDGATINEEAELKCHQVKDRVLILKKIKIGHDATVSSRSIVSGGAHVGDGVFLEPFTLVPEDVAIPAGEHWGGSPAIRVVSGWSQDAHEPKPTEEAGGGEVTAELDQMDDQMEHKEEVEAEGEAEVEAEVEAEGEAKGEAKGEAEGEAQGVAMVHTARSNVSGSNSATVVPITTSPPSPPSPPSPTQVRSASTSDPPSPPVYRQRQRQHMFPCWISVLQVLIIILSTVISIVIYLPSLIILVNVLMETTPDSIPALAPCRATVYCQNDLICTPLPSVVTQRNGRLSYRSSEKFCIGEEALEALAANVTARMEIDQASQTCQTVNARTSCLFPFQHEGGVYTSCTLDPTPNMTIETIAWCKTTDGKWDHCAAPCDQGDIEINAPEVYKADTYTSYSGLSWSTIFYTICASNVAALLLSLLYVAVQIRLLRCCERRIIAKANAQDTAKDAENAPYAIASCRFVLKWWMGKLLKVGGAMAQPLQGTMMMPYWLQLMGAKVGKNVEFSSTSGVGLDTLTLGDGTFVADSVMCGMPSVSHGTMRSRAVHLKDKAFIGNGSFVREGSVIANDTLIALQTAAPRTIDKPASTFLGSPPLSIEKREKALGDLSLTYRPSTCRKCCRCSFEVFGYLLYTLYGALFATTSLFAIDLCYGIYGERNVGVFVVTLPVVQLAMGGALCLLIVVSKWTIMCGRFKAGTYPLFSFYVWRTELVERLEENLAEPILLNMLDGTCWKVFYYRCMGARIGRRPYLGHSIVTEPDMISIGNDATVESGGTLQAHLFQDRMRLVKEVRLGHSVSVGSNSVVLLGGKLHDNVNLNPLSLNMRDEELPPRTEWTGSPATRTW